MIRKGPSGVLADLDPADLAPGAPGQFLRTNPLGVVQWLALALADLPHGAPGFLQTVAGVVQWIPLALSDLPHGLTGQVLTADAFGVATWQTPLGHSEETSLVSGTQETDQIVATGQGDAVFNPAALVAPTGGQLRTIRFQSVVWATFGMTAEVLLYNLTDGAPVVGTLLTTPANVPTLLDSGDLAVPAILPNAARTYEVRLRISAGVPGPLDRAFVAQSRLLASWI